MYCFSRQVFSGVFNPADYGVGAPDWRPRYWQKEIGRRFEAAALALHGCHRADASAAPRSRPNRGCCKLRLYGEASLFASNTGERRNRIILPCSRRCAQNQSAFGHLRRASIWRGSVLHLPAWGYAGRAARPWLVARRLMKPYPHQANWMHDHADNKSSAPAFPGDIRPPGSRRRDAGPDL